MQSQLKSWYTCAEREVNLCVLRKMAGKDDGVPRCQPSLQPTSWQELISTEQDCSVEREPAEPIDSSRQHGGKTERELMLSLHLPFLKDSLAGGD